MLGQRLRQLVGKVMGKPLLDENAVDEIVKELQRILISSDVNVRLVFELTRKVKERAIDKKVIKEIEAREQVIQIIYQELVSIIGEKAELAPKPMRIMLIGLYGSGKTTTVAKLGRYFQKRGLKVCLGAGDFERPGAKDQLVQLGKSLNIRVCSVASKEELMGELSKSTEDVKILDTSGKNALEQSLIDELRYYKESFKPDFVFLVMSADTGQVAEKQAKGFSEAIGIDGVIITRMDGSGKAGGALSACHVAKAKVYFAGTGEKVADFEEFDPKKYVARLLGFPDLETLIRKVEEATKEEKIELKEDDLKNLDFDVFLKQLKAARKMGPLGNVLSMLGVNDLHEDVMARGEKELKKFEAIISSMTSLERKNPDLLKSKTRIERIARGSGASAEEVRQMISRFKKMEKMVKQFSTNRDMKRKLEGMFKGAKF